MSTPTQFHLPPSTSYNTESLQIAIDALLLLQRGRQSNLKCSKTDPLFEMKMYLERLELDISTMNFIHIAGSKGKGSTSAFVENILYHHGYKTGLYTSPHLVSICERFRINTQTVPTALFLHCLWHVWDKIVTTTQTVPVLVDEVTGKSYFAYPPIPTFFAMLTLTSFYMFKLQNIDIVVCEVGLGGRFDATNIITPLITAIITLSLEHTEILGSTLSKIAWAKCGIFKPNTPIVVFPQEQEAWGVILDEAAKVGQIPLLISPYDHYPGVKLGIDGEYQIQNSNLALVVCSIVIHRLQHDRNCFPKNLNSLSFTNITSLYDMYVDLRATFLDPANLSHSNSPLSQSAPNSPSLLPLQPIATSVQDMELELIPHELAPKLSAPFNPHNQTQEIFMLQTLQTFDTLLHWQHSLQQQRPDSEQEQRVETTCNTSFPLHSLTNHCISPDGLNLDAWIPLVHADYQCYLDLIKTKQTDLKEFKTHQSTSSTSISPSEPSAPIPIHPVTSKLNVALIRYNNKLNYFTFHIKTLLPPSIRALCTTRLRGRCDTIFTLQPPELTATSPIPPAPSSHQFQFDPILWHIDGAHTPESVASCTQWFYTVCSKEPIFRTIQRKKQLLLSHDAQDEDHFSLPPEQFSPQPISTPNLSLVSTSPPPEATSISRPSPPDNDANSHDTPLQTPANSKRNNCEPVYQLQCAFQQRVLLFNCGHVRSPFILLAALVKSFYNTALYKSFLQHLTNLNLNTSQALPNPSSKLNPPFFQHVVLCPFDMDKPTGIPLPTLSALFDQYLTTPATSLSLPIHPEHSPLQLQTDLTIQFMEQLISTTAFSTASTSSPPTPSPSSTNAPLPSNTPFQHFLWQFYTMVVWDYMTMASLQSFYSRCQEKLLSFEVPSTATLYTLQSTHHHQQEQLALANNQPTARNHQLTAHRQYSSSSYRPHHYSTPCFPQQLSDRTNTTESTQNPCFTDPSLNFHPPLATLSRTFTFPTFSPNQQFTPQHTVHYHIFPTSCDAVNAILHISAQHAQYTSTQAEPIQFVSNQLDPELMRTSAQPRHSTSPSIPPQTPHVDSTTRVLVAGSLYLAGNSMEHLGVPV